MINELLENKNISHKTDILTCIASLSSDEKFTPPNTAKKILDLLPENIWTDDSITFLDPVSKSGVFLREITTRLIEGLENKIPDLEERITHILTKQVFGIGTSELTSFISRRSLYCSKYANGKYSIVSFDDEEGNLFNIFFSPKIFTPLYSIVSSTLVNSLLPPCVAAKS